MKSFKIYENYNEKNIRDIESHNIKSIKRMNEYLKRLFFSYLSMYHTFRESRDTIIKIQNSLNFRKPDSLVIENYNKLMTFISDQMKASLSETISDNKCSETLLIKPVNYDKKQFSHKLELMLFLNNLTCITKPIGTVSNVSLIEINDHIKIFRNTQTYDFVFIEQIDSTNCKLEITTEQFRIHLDKYLITIKELLGLFYNDVEYTKMAFKNLLNSVSEIIKISKNSCNENKWKDLLTEIKTNAEEFYCSLSNIDI